MIAYVAGTALGLALIARICVPPWSSRWLARWGSHRRSTRWFVAGLTLAPAVAAIVLAAGVLAASPGTRVTWAFLATAAAEAELAVAAALTRQWRFVPARRRRHGIVLAIASVVAVACFVPLASVASVWSLPVLVAGLGVAVLIALPLVWRQAPTTGSRVGDHGARTHAP